MKSKISRILLGAFFVFAGANHFIKPDFYYPLIPDYLPYPVFINAASGILEIVLGLGIFFKKYRNSSVIGLLVLLLLFVPSHVYFIQLGSCIPEGLCVPSWIGWMRLLVIHPLLMLWVFSVSNQSK
jgi:uncharacterized membrane protein